MPATMPPTTFPPKIPPPNLLPRLENQDVKLAELDVEDMLVQAEKRELGWQGVDMIVDGNFIEGNDDVEGESADEIGEGYKKALAYEALVNHAKERAPYVQLASERLQAVMQERNDMAFGGFFFFLSFIVSDWRYIASCNSRRIAASEVCDSFCRFRQFVVFRQLFLLFGSWLDFNSYFSLRQFVALGRLFQTAVIPSVTVEKTVALAQTAVTNLRQCRIFLTTFC
jgi:hypothetical protein